MVPSPPKPDGAPASAPPGAAADCKVSSISICQQLQRLKPSGEHREAGGRRVRLYAQVVTLHFAPGPHMPRLLVLSQALQGPSGTLQVSANGTCVYWLSTHGVEGLLLDSRDIDPRCAAQNCRGRTLETRVLCTGRRAARAGAHCRGQAGRLHAWGMVSSPVLLQPGLQVFKTLGVQRWPRLHEPRQRPGPIRGLHHSLPPSRSLPTREPCNAFAWHALPSSMLDDPATAPHCSLEHHAC